MKAFARILLCLALLAATAGVAQAQVTNSSIAGLVIAAEDASALPGAVVTAVHTPTNTRYTTVTRPDGRFFIANVRTGPYRITVQLEGFREIERTTDPLALGETLELRVELQLEGIEETVTVIGESNPIINPSQTGAASNVPTAAIENLPTISRDLTDFARLSPFFTEASENEDPNSISVAGRSSRYNNIQIDGAVNNDLFGLADQGTPGGQAETTPISLDAIQEIELVVADYDVRQGGFSGGSINAITRSGTNDLNGSVYFFTADDGLVGDGPDELGEFGEFEEEQFGFRIGGPINRDRIFYFVNAEIDDEDAPTGISLDGSGGQVVANGELADEARLFRQTLIDRFGFDPGSIGQDTLVRESDKLFGRLDFNLNDSNQLTLRHNFVDANNDVNRPNLGTFEFPSEAYLFESETNSTVAQLNTVVSATQFNELRLTFQTIEDRRGPRNGIEFPWIEIEEVAGQDVEFEAGTEPFSTANALDQEIFELTNDFTWIVGDHTLTLGTHNEFFSFDNLFIQNAFGSYEFRTLEDFVNQNGAREFEFTVIPPGQPRSQKFDVNQIGLYVGDQWAVRPEVTLTYGLRVDAPFFPDEPSRNPLTEQLYGLRTDDIPDGEALWQPRIGFNWDIEGDGTSQLRGGTGIFAGRTPYVWISNSYARTGIEQIFIRDRSGGIPFNPDPFGQTFDPTQSSTGEFNLIDPDFEFPQVWRTNLAYDRELGWWDLIGTVELVFSDSVEEIDYRNVNLVQSGVDPLDGRPLYGDEVSRDVSGAFLITNTDEGEQTNIAVKVERPFGRGVWGYVSYTYGDSEVVNEGSSSRAVSNWQFNEAVDVNDPGSSISDFQVEHRFNAAVSYRFNRDSRFPTTLSAYYNRQSGRPFSWIYNNAFPTVNSDTFFSNDLIYVPASPDEVVVLNGTFAQLDEFIEGQDCLRENRGSIAPRNCDRSPYWDTLDLKLVQDIPVRGTNLQVTFDLLNALNLIDDDEGALRFANFNAITPWRWNGRTDDGRHEIILFREVRDPENNPLFQTHNERSRWRAKLGLRWTF